MPPITFTFTSLRCYGPTFIPVLPVPVLLLFLILRSIPVDTVRFCCLFYVGYSCCCRYIPLLRYHVAVGALLHLLLLFPGGDVVRSVLLLLLLVCTFCPFLYLPRLPRHCYRYAFTFWIYDSCDYTAGCTTTRFTFTVYTLPVMLRDAFTHRSPPARTLQFYTYDSLRGQFRFPACYTHYRSGAVSHIRTRAHLPPPLHTAARTARLPTRTFSHDTHRLTLLSLLPLIFLPLPFGLHATRSFRYILPFPLPTIHGSRHVATAATLPHTYHAPSPPCPTVHTAHTATPSLGLRLRHGYVTPVVILRFTCPWTLPRSPFYRLSYHLPFTCHCTSHHVPLPRYTTTVPVVGGYVCVFTRCLLPTDLHSSHHAPLRFCWFLYTSTVYRTTLRMPTTDVLYVVHTRHTPELPHAALPHYTTRTAYARFVDLRSFPLITTHRFRFPFRSPFVTYLLIPEFIPSGRVVHWYSLRATTVPSILLPVLHTRRFAVPVVHIHLGYDSLLISLLRSPLHCVGAITTTFITAFGYPAFDSTIPHDRLL